LAAEEGCTLGALVRPASARGQPTWADVRLEVENFGLRISDCGLIQPIRNPKSEIRNRPIRRTFVHLVHCHSGRVGGAAMLEIDDVARTVQQVSSTDVPVPLSVVTQLADSAGRSLPARA